MTAYNFKRSGLSYVAAGAADGDAEAAGRRTTGGGPNGGGAATAAAAAGAADGDAEAAGRRTTGTIHDFRQRESDCGNGSGLRQHVLLVASLLRLIKIRGLDFKIGLETQHRSS